MAMLPLHTTFVLLLPVPLPRSLLGPDNVVAASRLSPAGFKPVPGEDAQARIDQVGEAETALLGGEYLESRRMARRPLGQVGLPSVGTGPLHADLFLVTHTAGAALWEC